MQAIAQRQHGARDSFQIPSRLARITGFLYLALVVFGMFSPLVLELLVAPGDAATTARNLLGSRWLFGASLVTWVVIVAADVAVSGTLYLLLEPANRALALVTGAFRLAYSAILGAFVLNLFDAYQLLTGAGRGAGLGEAQRQALAQAALDTFSTGFQFALIFFGFHLAALSVLLNCTRSAPRVLSSLLLIAGAGYVANGFATVLVADFSSTASTVLLMPALVGELGLTAWLLVKGFRAPQEAGSGRNSGAQRFAVDA